MLECMDGWMDWMLNVYIMYIGPICGNLCLCVFRIGMFCLAIGAITICEHNNNDVLNRLLSQFPFQPEEEATIAHPAW